MLRAARNPAQFRFIGIALFAILAACSGGSGGGGGSNNGSSGGSGGGVIPPTTFSISGTVAEFTSGAPIAGATVTIGSLPSSSTCAGWTGCGSPLSPVATPTTDANGSFSANLASTGSYMLTIGKDANPTSAQTYAILHRSISVSANLNLGTLKIAKLSSDETAWIARLNSDRATIAIPATGAVVVDEYAEEQARQWAIDVDAGTTPFTDAGFAPYQAAYGAKPGSIGSAGGALAVSDTWQDAETAWFAEKANCPGGDWRTCTFASNTGHYINLAQDSVVWAGLGEDLTGHYQGGTFRGFDVMTVYEGSTARTASIAHRAI